MCQFHLFFFHFKHFSLLFQIQFVLFFEFLQISFSLFSGN